MFRGNAHPEESVGRWQAAIASFDSYVTRIMCGLVFSLSCALGALHLPVGAGSESVGWYVAHSEERLTVEHVTSQRRELDTVAPATDFDDAAEEHVPEPPTRRETHADGSTSADYALRRLSGRKVLDVAQQMPEIVGGIGAYYIHIDYPKAAIQEGIEGRLVLSFIVDTQGVTSEIQVIEPLHPACDSAAVQALRRTRFVPGLQNGERVEVKMHLPVRFQLLPHATVEEQARLEG